MFARVIHSVYVCRRHVLFIQTGMIPNLYFDCIITTADTNNKHKTYSALYDKLFKILQFLL